MSHRPGPKAPSQPGVGRRGALAAFRMIGASARFAWRRPVAVLTSLAVIGGAGIFAWNATTQQTTRHPAPLFAPQKPVAAKAEAQPPQAQPPKRAELPSPQTTGATRPELPTPPRRPAGPDASGSIVRTAERAAKPTEQKGAEAKPVETKLAPQPRVASAQKALAKLGYGPIVADGVLGAQTKQALERFERDKKLPVTGELGTRTARQLATLSGITVQ